MEEKLASEAELDGVFAEAIEHDASFRDWLIKGGRFSRSAGQARLLAEEQANARDKSVAAWWRWWWCRLPDGTESETDLFFVFETSTGRFAFHIENKPPHGKLTLKQAASYRRRAIFMANKDRWLNYSDFETILLAPNSLVEENAEQSLQFDRIVTYESVAAFVPTFEGIR